MNRPQVRIRDYAAEAALFRRRAMISLAVVLLVFLVLLVNLFQLQVSGYQEFQTRSNSNRIMVLPVAPNRGLIYDRNGHILADNTPVYSIEMVPEEVSNPAHTLAELIDLLDLDPAIQERFEQRLRQTRRFPQIPVIEGLTEEQLETFAVHQHRFPGVTIEARLQRYYPHGDLFTHTLGYVGRINRQDIQRLQHQEVYPNYAATRTIGKLGIERQYETELHGQVGYQTVEVNNRGRVIRTLEFTPPQPGKDLILELDLGLQEVLQEQLGDLRGAAVVLDARTGGVMGMYSNPGYDPNWFVRGISTDRYQLLTGNRNNPLINRATQGRYSPASTIKPHLGLLGLKSGTITADSTKDCTGYYQLEGYSRKFRDWRPEGHGRVDLAGAITVSCNTYFYDLAHRLGIDRISGFMTELGFGRRTGIDLREESAAVMPSRDWKMSRLGEPWYRGETLSIGIGQSYWTATPLQMASATSVLVNQGRRLRPRLAGAISEELPVPVPLREETPIVLSEQQHWQTIKSAMEDVIHHPRGTAYGAFQSSTYRAAGKTGTAQLVSINHDLDDDSPAQELAEHLRTNSTFVGYAPADQPEIVISLVLENTGGSGRSAAPVARAIMDYYFTTMQNRPDLLRDLPNFSQEAADADH